MRAAKRPTSIRESLRRRLTAVESVAGARGSRWLTHPDRTRWGVVLAAAVVIAALGLAHVATNGMAALTGDDR